MRGNTLRLMPIMSVREAATLAGMGTSTLRTLARRGIVTRTPGLAISVPFIGLVEAMVASTVLHLGVRRASDLLASTISGLGLKHALAHISCPLKASGVEYDDDGWAARVRCEINGVPMVIDPSRAFGRPLIDHGIGVRLDDVLELAMAGDDSRTIAEAYGLPLEYVESILSPRGSERCARQ